MPKRKFDKLRDSDAIDREKRWRKARMKSRQEGKDQIARGIAQWKGAREED